MPSKHSGEPMTPPRLARARRQQSDSPAARLRPLAHQIVNQLTVINLSCFKLRVTLKDIAANAAGDIERLQHAVAEMNRLVEVLSQIQDSSPAPGIPARAKSRITAHPPPDNVYPLFETKKTAG